MDSFGDKPFWFAYDANLKGYPERYYNFREKCKRYDKYLDRLDDLDFEREKKKKEAGYN